MKAFAKILLLLLISASILHAQRTTIVGICMIKYYEGFKSKAYKCPAGKWTIYYGHTGKDVVPGMMGTRQQGEEVLTSDLIGFEKYIPRKISRNLKWHEFDALVAFSYNVGYRFTPGKYYDLILRNAVNNGNTKVVMIELRRYNKAKVNGTYVVLIGLTRRRNAEAQLYADNNFKLSPYAL